MEFKVKFMQNIIYFLSLFRFLSYFCCSTTFFFGLSCIVHYCMNIFWLANHSVRKFAQYSASSSQYVPGRCNVFAGWKSLIGWPMSLDKHIKRINEALRAWRTCKLHDLNNGWADKTSFAIYSTVFRRLSIIFRFPLSVRSSRFFVIFDHTTGPVSKTTTCVLLETSIANALLIFLRLQHVIWTLKAWIRYFIFLQKVFKSFQIINKILKLVNKFIWIKVCTSLIFAYNL